MKCLLSGLRLNLPGSFWISALLFFLTPLLFQSGACGASPQDAGRALLIRHALVFDGKHFLPDTDVLIESGLIQEIGKDLPLKDEKDTRQLDASADTLLPGLIDAHAHACEPALKQALVFGVCTELDMFTASLDFLRREKKLAAEGKTGDHADLRSAGILATAAGGHGTEYGVAIPTIERAEDAQQFVDARIAEGSDYIKIVYDDCRIYGFLRPTLSKATMKALVSAAHKRGKMAIAHIGSRQDAVDVIDAGADGLAHLFTDRPPSSDFASRLAHHHAFVVPTLSVLESICGIPSGASLASDPKLQPYLSRSTRRRLQTALGSEKKRLSEKYAEEAVLELSRAGVPILAGTDAPNEGTCHGASLHRELELLVRAGLSNEQALAAATSTPAAVFALNDRGVIAPGKRADLLLVHGDLSKDIRASRDIVSVWKQGFELDRAAYCNQLQQESKAASLTPSGAESGRLSDFEAGKLACRFGAGFFESSDSIYGGSSRVNLKMQEGGANHGAHSLFVCGKVSSARSKMAWAGALFCPGPERFAPANLSFKKGLSFWTKGDAGRYSLQLYTESKGLKAASADFVAGKNWEKINIPFAKLGTDGHDVTAILFASERPGDFAFALDDIRLE